MKNTQNNPSLPKLKLPLTNKTKTTLLDCVERVEKRLALGKEAELARQKEEEFLAKLTSEMLELESRYKTDRTDGTVLDKLTSKKNHVAALKASMDSEVAAPQSPRSDVESYHELMVELFDALRPSFDVYFQDALDEIVARIRPFVQHDAHARDIAKNTWFMIYFFNWRSGLVNPVCAKKSVVRLVEVAKNILNGDDFYPFDPKIEKENK